jgi:uroporphyrinogen-III synthase
VVTRPVPQAARLAELIRKAGGEPILFPVLEIFEARDLAPLHQIIDRLEEFDFAIFISPTAVDKAMNLIRARRAWPAGLRAAAVGRGSQRELARFGVTSALAPASRFDSEGLLELPELSDLTGRKVVIFRGEGGRELLGDELVRRGAELTYAECYRRGRPEVDAAPLLQRWVRNEVQAVTVTSGESMRNLFDLVGKLGQQWLRNTPVFVTHERIADVARELGVKQVFVTAPGDEGLLDGLIEWRRNENKP